jgi:uncharacterized membrane protein
MKRLFALTILILVSCTNQTPKYPVVHADNGIVKIPLNEVNDGRVHFFSYKSGGKSVNFFIRMDGAEKLHACFDACYTCYKKKKGYRVEGTDIICNECNTKFRLADETWKDVGGCAPIALPMEIQGNFILFKAADLGRGEKLF